MVKITMVCKDVSPSGGYDEARRHPDGAPVLVQRGEYWTFFPDDRAGYGSFSILVADRREWGRVRVGDVFDVEITPVQPRSEG